MWSYVAVGGFKNYRSFQEKLKWFERGVTCWKYSPSWVCCQWKQKKAHVPTNKICADVLARATHKYNLKEIHVVSSEILFLFGFCFHVFSTAETILNSGEVTRGKSMMTHLCLWHRPKWNIMVLTTPASVLSLKSSR